MAVRADRVLGLALVLFPSSLRAQEPAPNGASSTLHLAARLAAARIESPLKGLAPARNVADLSDPSSDLLLDEGFEEFDWSFAGWNQVPEARVVPEGEGHALALTAPSRAFLGWVLPVRSDAFYRFERSVRVRGQPFSDFVVVESRVAPEDTPLDTEAYFLAGRGVALKVHPLALQDGEESGGAWQRSGTSFTPTPRTRSLVVLQRPDVGSALALGGNSTMTFDDVRLEEIAPTRTERMRLLMGAYRDPLAAPEDGMRKAGLLLPLPSPEGVQEGEAAESNYDWRSALYAPPKTELAFELALPEGARLRLATGLARETPAGSSARFQVEIAEAGGSPELLHDRVRTARMSEWHWEELDLDLAARAGKKVTLTLRTLAESGDPHPLWADPRIERAARAADPLVILIAVDTLRADRLGCYGYARPTSPALDRLAKEGVRFDQARSNCNWTCPSFASIFTGLVPSHHGVDSYGPATPLPDELVTLAEHFQARGYATRSIAYKVPLFDGHYEQGFDQAFNVPRDEIRGEENLARAFEWLDAHRSGPAFLFLHFNDPHQPFVQPAPFDRKFGPPAESLGLSMPPNVPGIGEKERQQLFHDLYDGAVAYVDDCIGRFLDALRARGLYEGATIAFVADHGEQLWERGRFGHGGEELFDEVVRVPLIVKPPARTFEPGRVITADASGFDVMPTLLELAGIEPAAPLDARSLVPFLRGKPHERGRPVVTETSSRGLALVDSGFKYILPPGGNDEALYHLPSDPGEQHDLAAERPEDLARLRGLALEYLLRHRPGTFLLVRNDEPARLTLSSRAVRKLVGPATRLAAAGQTSTVELPISGWTLLELESPNPESITIEGLASRSSASTPWAERRLQDLAPGVWRVRGPERPSARDTSLDPIDAEQLDDLRQLGYAE